MDYRYASLPFLGKLLDNKIPFYKPKLSPHSKEQALCNVLFLTTVSRQVCEHLAVSPSAFPLCYCLTSLFPTDSSLENELLQPHTKSPLTHSNMLKGIYAGGMAKWTGDGSVVKSMLTLPKVLSATQRQGSSRFGSLFWCAGTDADKALVHTHK